MWVFDCVCAWVSFDCTWQRPIYLIKIKLCLSLSSSSSSYKYRTRIMPHASTSSFGPFAQIQSQQQQQQSHLLFSRFYFPFIVCALVYCSTYTLSYSAIVNITKKWEQKTFVMEIQYILRNTLTYSNLRQYQHTNNHISRC